MKIFDSKEEYDSKVNFVDENNVFVGYDQYQNCCENAGWYISDKEENVDRDWENPKEEKFDLEDYRFDLTYFVEVPLEGEYAEGGLVRFKLVSVAQGCNLYLHIFNSHNGYYSHGFEVKDGEQQIRYGSI